VSLTEDMILPAFCGVTLILKNVKKFEGCLNDLFLGKAFFFVTIWRYKSDGNLLIYVLLAVCEN
jgi:hypothetical protein